MLKKTITFTDLNEQEVTETHYFHLNKADLLEMELSERGGLQKKLEAIIESEDGAAIIREFKNLVRRSYGQKSEDGSRFIKDPEAWETFVNSEAYSALFVELVTDAQAAADFVNGIVPAALRPEIAQIGGAMGKPRTPAEARALEARKHPSDTAATMAEPREVASEEVGQPQPGSGSVTNIFDKENPKILTPEEVVNMDAVQLKDGLADGRYKLQ